MRRTVVRGMIAGTPLIGIPVAWRSAWASSADDLMTRNHEISTVDSIRFQSTMLLVSIDGPPRVRKMETLSKCLSTGVSKVITRFTFPADIRGIAFLQIEHADDEGELWVYLPALKRSRRLLTASKKDCFLGSDFSYGDLLPSKVPLYEHNLLRTETVNGEDLAVIESVPRTDKTRNESGYSRKVTWLRKRIGLEARVEYHDLNGHLLKVQTAAEPTLVGARPERWILREREMINRYSGHRTRITLDALEPGIAIPDEQFSVRALEDGATRQK